MPTKDSVNIHGRYKICTIPSNSPQAAGSRLLNYMSAQLIKSLKYVCVLRLNDVIYWMRLAMAQSCGFKA